MITGFIGNIIFKSVGFYITSIIFLFINLGGILMILNCEFIKTQEIFKNENDEVVLEFKISQILYFLACYIIFFIGSGGPALLSQFILNDSFSKLKTYMLKNQLEIISRNVYYIRKYFKESQNLKNNNNNEKINDNTISDEVDDSKNIPINFKIDENDKEFKDFDKKNKSQFDNYFIISFTTIIGYFLKYLLNVILIKYNIKYDQFFYYITGIYTSSIIISLFFYFLLKKSK